MTRRHFVERGKRCINGRYSSFDLCKCAKMSRYTANNASVKPQETQLIWSKIVKSEKFSAYNQYFIIYTSRALKKILPYNFCDFPRAVSSTGKLRIAYVRCRTDAVSRFTMMRERPSDTSGDDCERDGRKERIIRYAAAVCRKLYSSDARCREEIIV